MKKAMKKFQETHNWSKYVLKQKHKRVKKLREEGVINAWNVVNFQAKPIRKYIRKLLYDNKVTIPKKYVENFELKKGDKFEVSVENEKIIFKHINRLGE